MSESSVDQDNAALHAFNNMTAAERATAMADAEGWKPEDGDELRGVVIGIKSGISEHKEKAGRNPNYPIVFVLREDAPDACTGVHCFQTVLENEVRGQRPMPGEYIYIKRIGASETAKKGQTPTIRFAVYVEREQGTDDPWSHMQ